MVAEEKVMVAATAVTAVMVEAKVAKVAKVATAVTVEATVAAALTTAAIVAVTATAVVTMPVDETPVALSMMTPQAQVTTMPMKIVPVIQNVVWAETWRRPAAKSSMSYHLGVL